MFRFQTAFDAQDLKQDKWKVTLDATPVEFLDLGLEFIWKDNDYQAKNDTLGRWKDKRDEIYVERCPTAIRPRGASRSSATGRRVKYESQHRVVGTSTATTPPGPYDPNMPADGVELQLAGHQQGRQLRLRHRASTGRRPRSCKVSASCMYYKTDGQVDFAAPSTVAAASYPQPVGLFDDSKRTAFNLKGTYAFSKAISLTGGWAYEKYDYMDAQYDGYRYTIPAANRADSYLMGYLQGPELQGQHLLRLGDLQVLTQSPQHLEGRAPGRGLFLCGAGALV